MSAGRLYLRCLGWGLVTGAVAGGIPAAVVGILAVASTGIAWLAVLATAAGLFYGTLVAVVPSLLGGLAVVVVLVRRHPRPASVGAVHRDLNVVFAAVVVVLDIAVLVPWLALGGWPTIVGPLIVLLVVNAVVALVLRAARASIAGAWAGDPAVPVVGDARSARPTDNRWPQAP